MKAPLVSVVIPAYHERHFEDALRSALAQTFADLEVVVCDDSGDERIAAAVARAGDPRVRYERNPARLGFGANFSRGFALARAPYVKFLNDDDRLAPRCLEALLAAMESNPAVTLATSRRAVIDAEGRPAPDVPATTPISHVSALMRGVELGDFCLVNGMNLVGEPSTVLFRRADLDVEDGQVFRWHGRDYHCLADLSTWLRLLARGLAYYGAAPLSEYRRHEGQEQREVRTHLDCLLERAWILGPARAAGFLAASQLRAAAVRAARAMSAPFERAAALDGRIPAALAEFRRSLGEFEQAG